MKKLFILMVAISLAFAMPSCKNPRQARQAGKAIEKAIGKKKPVKTTSGKKGESILRYSDDVIRNVAQKKKTTCSACSGRGTSWSGGTCTVCGGKGYVFK